MKRPSAIVPSYRATNLPASLGGIPRHQGNERGHAPVRKLATRLALLFFALLAFPAMAGDTTIEIGNGDVSNYPLPFDVSWRQQRVQIIVLASEMNGAASVNSLALNLSQKPSIALRNWTIRMKPTTVAAYQTGDDLESEDWTTVYEEGEQTIPATGWQTFTFTTPFAYDGGSNILVDISFNNSSTGSTSGLCYATRSDSPLRMLHGYGNGSQVSPLLWSDTVGPAAYTRNYFPMMRLGVSDPVAGGMEDVTIGTGTTQWEFPMDTYYPKSRTQVIYRASDIGKSGRITYLSLNVAGIPGRDLGNWTIRMKQTALSSYSSYNMESDGWTVVYHNTMRPTSTGWCEFALSNPFMYDSTDAGKPNLMIDFSVNNSSASSKGYCYATAPSTGDRSCWGRSYTSSDNPLAWSGSQPSYHDRHALFPNIKLTLAEGSEGSIIRLFDDDFPTDTLNTTNWTTTVGWHELQSAKAVDGYALHPFYYSSTLPSVSSKVLDLSSYASAELRFSCAPFLAAYMDTGDRLSVEYWTGTAWATLWSEEGRLMSDSFTEKTVSISGTQLHGSFRFRFSSNCTGSGESFCIDNVSLVATPGTQEAPAITWPNPSSITYGTALSSTQLNATANTTGTFTYDHPVGTVLHAGTHTLSVTFTPDNPASWTSATAQATLVVNKRTLSARVVNETRVHGEDNPSFTVYYTGFANGDTSAVLDTPATATTTATAASPIGTYPITLSGASDNDYSFTYHSGTLTVAAQVTVTGVTPDTCPISDSACVSLAGTNFAAGASVTLTKAGQSSISASNVQVLSATEISCEFNIGRIAPGDWDVVVRNSNGISDTLPAAFHVTAPAPTVTAITPATELNTGSVSITNLAGSDFLPGATVRLAMAGQPDIVATAVTVVSRIRITCTVDLASAATGDWSVVVTNSDGQSDTLDAAFAVTDPLQLSIGTNETSCTVPLATVFKVCRTQVIYLASEVGTGGRLLSLSLNVDNLPGAMSAWTIRMKHTTKSSYANVEFESAGWTTVYASYEPAGTTGWRTFVFTTPFAYDGVSNLMVDFSFYNNTAVLLSGTVRGTTATEDRVCAACSDVFQSPASWSGIGPGTDYHTSNKVPDIKLTCGPLPPLDPPTLTSVTPVKAFDHGTANPLHLVGTEFRSGASVRLTKAGEADIVATDPEVLFSTDAFGVVSGERISCFLDLTGAAEGDWDVWVTNSDGQTAFLPGGFTVLPTGGRTGAQVFADAFPTTTFDATNWPDTYSALIYDINPYSPPCAVRIFSSGTSTPACIASKVLDLSGYATAELAFHVDPGPADWGDTIDVEYWTGTAWELAWSVPARRPSDGFSRCTVAFDGSQLHDSFRFRLIGRQDDDGFVLDVDDVSLAAYGGAADDETPTLAWADPSPITYGTALSDAQLDATANTAGTFVYMPPAGTVLHAGRQALTVTFYPDDTDTWKPTLMLLDLDVNKATLTYTGDDVSRFYGADNPALSTSGAGFVNEDTAAVLDTEPMVTTEATADSPAGTYAITVSGGADNDYDFAYVDGTLTVDRAPVTVTATDASREQGEANPAFSHTVAGLVGSDTLSSIGVTVSYSCTADGSSEPGRYAITPSGAATTTNYAITYVAGTLLVMGPTPTVKAISPESGLNHTETDAIVTGTDFQSEATVKLARTGQADIPAANVSVSAKTRIECTFDLAGAAPGDWDVVATNPDGRSGTLVCGFRVKAKSFFEDTFATGAFDFDTKWDFAQNATVVAGAAELRKDGYSCLQTLPIDLSAGSNVLLTFSLRSSSSALDAGEWLYIRYHGSDGEVHECWDTIAGGYVHTTQSEQITILLPASALHEDFYLWFTPALSSPDYCFYIDDVRVANAGVADAVLEDAFPGNDGLIPSATLDTTKWPETVGTVLPRDTESHSLCWSVALYGHNPSILTSKTLDLSVYDTAELSFWYSTSGAVYLEEDDTLALEYWDGTAWSPIWFLIGSSYLPEGFTEKRITLSGAQLHDSFRIRFVSTASGMSELFYIDDVLVLGVSADEPPERGIPAIAWNDADPITYGTALSDTQLNATADAAGTLVYDPPAGTALHAGTHTLSVAFVPDDPTSWRPVSTEVGLTVEKATITATADDVSRNYGEANPPLTVTCTGFVNGDTVAALDTLPTSTTTATAASPAGTYPIIPANGADADYGFDYINGTLTIDKLNQTIAFTALATKTYGDAPFALQAAASSGLTVSYASSDTNVATVDGTTVTIVGAGTTAITASQPGNDNWNAATAVEQTLTVNKAELTVTGDDATRKVGLANPVFTCTPTGLVGTDTLASIGLAVDYDCDANEASPIGDYPITPKGNAATGNYTVDYVAGMLHVIGKDVPTITWNKPADIVYGTPLSATQLNASADTAGTFVYDPAAGVLHAGTRTLSVTFTPANEENWAAVTKTVGITVTKAKLTAMAGDESRPYGQANPTFTVTCTGFVNGDTVAALDIAPGATTTATTASPVAAYDIVPSAGVAADYDFIYVKGTLAVTPATLTCTADNQIRPYAAPNPELTVTYAGLANGDAAPAHPPDRRVRSRRDERSGRLPHHPRRRQRPELRPHPGSRHPHRHQGRPDHRLRRTGPENLWRCRLPPRRHRLQRPCRDLHEFRPGRGHGQRHDRHDHRRRRNHDHRCPSGGRQLERGRTGRRHAHREQGDPHRHGGQCLARLRPGQPDVRRDLYGLRQ